MDGTLLCEERRTKSCKKMILFSSPGSQVDKFFENVLIVDVTTLSNFAEGEIRANVQFLTSKREKSSIFGLKSV